jgi:hypothetical protein
MAIERIGSDVFESGCELIDVSMMSRPDTNWLFTDAAGHVHRWHEVGSSEPAQSYQPEWAYEVPTLRWVVDDRWIDEDGEERETGHSECVQCGEHVTPRHTSDTTRQMIPGLRWYRINGQSVSEDEFKRLATGRTDRP